MVINTVTGRKQWTVDSGQWSVRTAARIRCALRDQKGFSLFELMIAMFILIILLSVAVPVYQRTVQHAKEVVLKENLWQMQGARSIGRQRQTATRSRSVGRNMREIRHPISKRRMTHNVRDLVTGSEREGRLRAPLQQDSEGRSYDGEDIISVYHFNPTNISKGAIGIEQKR